MVTLKVNKTKKMAENAIVERAIKEYILAKADADILAEKMKFSKEIIANFAKDSLDGNDNSTITLGVEGAGEIKVSFGWDITVSDEQKLRVLLGDRFDDLVNTSMSFKPVTKLKEMALEDDGLKECLSIKEKAPTLSVVK